jgi:hypothetical protein
MDGDTVVGTVKISQKVTRDFIENTLCTALDAAWGFSHYWIEDVVVSGLPEGEAIDFDFEAITLGGKLKIKTMFGEWRTLTLNKYLGGLALYASLPEGKTPAQLEENPADGSEADCILQLALFGEVVYG